MYDVPRRVSLVAVVRRLSNVRRRVLAIRRTGRADFLVWFFLFSFSIRRLAQASAGSLLTIDLTRPKNQKRRNVSMFNPRDKSIAIIANNFK